MGKHYVFHMNVSTKVLKLNFFVKCSALKLCLQTFYLELQLMSSGYGVNSMMWSRRDVVKKGHFSSSG
jgi:hypothetical protein